MDALRAFEREKIWPKKVVYALGKQDELKALGVGAARRMYNRAIRVCDGAFGAELERSAP